MSGITLTEVDDATIATPATGKVTVFMDDTLGPAYKDDAGSVTSLQGVEGELSYTNHGDTGSSEDIDAGTNVHRLVLNAATVTLTTSNWPASGTPGIVRLIIVQDGTGGRVITWPGAVSWGAAGAPTLQTGAGAIDVVDLLSYDGGTTILGSYEVGVGGYRAGGTDVAIADGGTGASTKAAGFDALSPMTTSGDVIYGGASGTGTRLPKGTNGDVLTLASGLPSWAAPAAGSVTFKGAKAYTTGQTASNAVIVFGTGEIFDTDSIHDLASNQSRMTIPTTGYWEIKAHGFVSRTDARLSIYVNGAIVRGGNTSGASAGNYASTSAVLNLTAADYVEIFANTTTTTTFGDNGTIGDNFVFSVVFLGA